MRYPYEAMRNQGATWKQPTLRDSPPYDWAAVAIERLCQDYHVTRQECV